MNQLTEKLVQAVMEAIETADMDTYINSTRQDRIKAAIRSVLGQEWDEEKIDDELNKIFWEEIANSPVIHLEEFMVRVKKLFRPILPSK